MTVKKLVIYTDGASRGNPGPAAIGVVIQDENGRAVDTISQRLGETTNNQAEYRAIIVGLEKALAQGATHVELRSDSELVVHQLSGKYRVKNEGLKPLVQKVEILRSKFSALSVSYIPREKNIKADRLANQALDGKKGDEPRKTSDVTVRSATPADYNSLYPIFAELGEQHASVLPEVFRRTSLEEVSQHLNSLLSEADNSLLVAESRGQVVGFIRLSIRESPDVPIMVPRRYAQVNDIAVRKDFQRRGTGEALMLEAEKWAKSKGLNNIELNVWEFNRNAFAFYQKLGYVTSSRHMWKHV